MFEKCFNYIIMLNYIIFLMMSIAVQFLNTGCAHFSLLDYLYKIDLLYDQRDVKVSPLQYFVGFGVYYRIC